MKTPSVADEPVKEKISLENPVPIERRIKFGFDEKLSPIVSSVTVYSLLIFVVLNIMLLIVYGPYHRAGSKSKDADDSLAKLHKIVFNSSYEANQSGPWPWWVARAYFGNSLDNVPAPGIAILGDSQANAAIIQADAVTINKSMDCAMDRQCITLKNSLEQELHLTADLRLVNLSIGGAMPSDLYLISKSLFTKNQHPKLVIITLSPRSFLDATLPAASSTEIFQFFSPFVSLDKLVDQAFNNPVQKWFWLAQRTCALFDCRQDMDLSMHEFIESCLYRLYPKQTKHSSTAQSIYGSNGLVPAGSSVVGPIPLSNFLDNKKEYSQRFAEMKPQTLTAQSAFFLAMLKYLDEIKVPVIVIEMPMLQPVKALLPEAFWERYRAGLKNNCLATNSYWLDLDTPGEFPQGEFLDYVHLNAVGGKHFINKITDFIAADDSLRGSLR